MAIGGGADRRAFDRDPLSYLTAARSRHGNVFPLPDGSLCVADHATAKAVLANHHDRYVEHSDFFHTARGVFGTREIQLEIGRGSRELLRRHLAHRAAAPAALVAALGPTSEWPDAGNRLVHALLRDALLNPDTPASVRAAADLVFERAVLAGVRERRSPAARLVTRLRVMRTLRAAIRLRLRQAHAEPADLLDVILAAAPDADPDDLAEVFLSYLFAVSGSMGFALGWSVYLVGRSEPDGPPRPDWVVREALRLWPVAWMFGRRPALPHELAGTTVTPEREVMVCTYLVHRDPAHWSAPDEFHPARWARADDRRAYLPFGWGTHTCASASVVLELVTDVLALLLDRRFTVTTHDGAPHVGPALAPPRFTLRLR